jgi:hypothetical protein
MSTEPLNTVNMVFKFECDRPGADSGSNVSRKQKFRELLRIAQKYTIALDLGNVKTYFKVSSGSKKMGYDIVLAGEMNVRNLLKETAEAFMADCAKLPFMLEVKVKKQRGE